MKQIPVSLFKASWAWKSRPLNRWAGIPGLFKAATFKCVGDLGLPLRLYMGCDREFTGSVTRLVCKQRRPNANQHSKLYSQFTVSELRGEHNQLRADPNHTPAIVYSAVATVRSRPRFTQRLQLYFYRPHSSLAQRTQK